MEIFTVLFFGAVVAALVASFARARTEQLNRTWSRAAQVLDVTMRSATMTKPPQLEGQVDGFPVTVDTHKRRTGKSRTVWTRYQVDVDSLPAGLEIKPAGFMAGISKVFGAQDITVGDAVFDGLVVVKGHDESQVRSFLSAERRDAVRRLLESYPGAVVDARGVSYRQKGRTADADRLVHTVRELIRASEALAAEAPREIAEAVTRASAEPTEFGGLAALAASATTEADATAEAADPIEADVDAPLSPSPEAEEAARLEAVSVELAAPAPEPALSGPEREVADFCSAVFHPGALSFESSRVFDERFAGRQVTWSGTLKAVEPYRFDFVFGQDPGTKATFVIHAAEGATFGGGEISAVIQLPAGSDGLDSRIGEDLQFSGTLEKVDGFVRNVFLTNANIQ